MNCKMAKGSSQKTGIFEDNLKQPEFGELAKNLKWLTGFWRRKLL